MGGDLRRLPPVTPNHLYMLKNQVVSWISQNLFDNLSYTVRNGLNKGLRRRGGLGWLPFESNDTHELRFWRKLPLEGKVVYDIGAFHGLLTIFFARRARAVVAWGKTGTDGHLSDFISNQSS